MAQDQGKREPHMMLEWFNDKDPHRIWPFSGPEYHIKPLTLPSLSPITPPMNSAWGGEYKGAKLMKM